MYEIVEHTADVGIRASALSLDALFAEAACGLFSVIVDDLRSIRPLHVRELEIFDAEMADGNVDFLLVDWLGELLHAFEVDRLLCCEFRVTLRPAGLTATVRGEPIDPQRHRLAHEVKAITYHGLKVQQTDQGWQAEVILDV